MLRALDGLVGRLQAVAVLLEQLRDGLVADGDLMLRVEFLREDVGALAGPSKRRLRIAAGDGIEELLERGPHLRVCDVERAQARAASHFHDVTRMCSSARLVPSLSHRADRHPCRARDRGDTAIAKRVSLGAGPEATRSLIQRRLQQTPLLTNDALSIHCRRRSRSDRRGDPAVEPTLDRHPHSRALKRWPSRLQ